MPPGECPEVDPAPGPGVVGRWCRGHRPRRPGRRPRSAVARTLGCPAVHRPRPGADRRRRRAAPRGRPWIYRTRSPSADTGRRGPAGQGTRTADRQRAPRRRHGSWRRVRRVSRRGPAPRPPLRRLSVRASGRAPVRPRRDSRRWPSDWRACRERHRRWISGSATTTTRSSSAGTATARHGSTC